MEYPGDVPAFRSEGTETILGQYMWINTAESVAII